MELCNTSNNLLVIDCYIGTTVKDKLKFNESGSNLSLSDLSSCDANVSQLRP